WVFHRPDNKRRSHTRPCARHRRQVGAHRNAVGIGLMHPILRVENVLVVVPSAEEADFDMRALTPNVSLRYIASQIEARVFSSAHTPVRPPGFSRRTSIVPPARTPVKRCSTVPSIWP